MASTITSRTLLSAAALLALAACARVHISPLSPPPFRTEVAAGYDVTWTAIIRALAQQNVPLRAVARDSGVVASDEFVSPINLYADCGQLGGDQLEGEAVVSFTVFAESNGRATRIQVNSKMRTQAHRRGNSGKLRPVPVFQCASTGRFEANLLDAVREFVKE
ncbi:MAG: hypothetical protein AUH29_06980 [Candidatus Rokubacteria bacterium 13_1_40CM_69_27]|nr:MAG: hypothetical protein AUH29_06980 [Candidatus Rokubacteria bacterium 13_1_40CM_69_27]OLC34100.1 MAG: hypothetical protein AUH81_12965 [Candidatus Rokubacteria bacterium 13_1_40CM_4_69_5]